MLASAYFIVALRITCSFAMTKGESRKPTVAEG